MRFLSPRPLFAVGVFVVSAAAGRAHAQSPAPPAGGPSRTAQSLPPTDGPLGHSRSDQAPGNDSPAGRPRPAPSGGPTDLVRVGGDRSAGGQGRSVPPLDGAPRPEVPANPPSPTPTDLPGGAPQADGQPAAASKAAPTETAEAPAWRAELASDRFLKPHEPRPALLEIGPSVIYEARSTKGSGGPTYKANVAPSFALRARLRSWLVVGARYRTVAHELTLPAQSFGLEGNSFETARRTYVRSLDMYVHPTLRPTSWLSVWATVGLGWGQIAMPPISVVDPPNGSTLRPRTGVFGDVPLGAGVSYTLPFRWLSVSCEGLFEPVFYQSGAIYEKTPYINRAGAFAEATPMSKLSRSAAVAFGLSLAL
jgi:hypothetical protein